MSWTVEDSNAKKETIKCVVVGDTAVGKTRLICARTCNASLHLPQMLSTHVPTIWAIDQYRIHKDVLQRSWMNIDGVNVSLLLWDTFGDHEKDRQFAYGRADVILLCFSISSYKSLKNCKTKWLPEIRYYCPHTPIVLVGCKNDLRHIYKDQSFLDLWNEKSHTFVKLVPEHDLVTRAEGREVASIIGAAYYEASVYTQYGVDCVFENACRMALIARRHQRFWVTNLKNVIPPVLQPPYCPPKPKEPREEALPSEYGIDMTELLNKPIESDVTLIIGETYIPAHKVVLSAASSYFKEIFTAETGTKNAEVRLSVLDNLSILSIRCFLSFLYTGDMQKLPEVILAEIKQAAYLTDIKELMELTDGLKNDHHEKIFIMKKRYQINYCKNILETCFKEKLFSDVTFIVDNGECYGHRSLLIARCDVMAAMFKGGFKESTEGVVPFPNVTKETFDMGLLYLYTDVLDEKVHLENCGPLIILADRLGLCHLISIIEERVIEEIRLAMDDELDIREITIELLKISQEYNADQLADWCQYYILINYLEIYTNLPDHLEAMHPEYQAYLNKNRWPPVHYLKEITFYECLIRNKHKQIKQSRFPLWQSTKRRIRKYWNSLHKSKTSTNFFSFHRNFLHFSFRNK